MNMEIERRFKLHSPVSPSVLEGAKIFHIAQGYGKKIRVRKRNDEYFMTIKEGSGLVRKEWEVEIPKWVFDKVWSGVGEKYIEKDRYVIPYGAFTLELDVYKGRHTPLIILECEFKNTDDARAFSLPEWASGAIEVTEDERYANRTLATRGLPED